MWQVAEQAHQYYLRFAVQLIVRVAGLIDAYAHTPNAVINWEGGALTGVHTVRGLRELYAQLQAVGIELRVMIDVFGASAVQVLTPMDIRKLQLDLRAIVNDELDGSDPTNVLRGSQMELYLQAATMLKRRISPYSLQHYAKSLPSPKVNA